MKIAFVLTQSLESPSGLGRFGPLARQMAALGHSVELFALHPDYANLSVRNYLDRGVYVSYVSQMHVQKTGARKTYFGPGKLLGIVLAATLRLSFSIYRSPAEILQVCKPHPMNSLAARLARRGRPIYFDCDDYEAQTNVFASAWQRRVVSWFENSVVSDAAGLTVNTRFLEHYFTALGFPADRIIYIPNAVEPARFTGPFDRAGLRKQLGISLEAPLVIYAGTMGLLSHPVDLLLKAFPLVLQQLPNARLLLVGGGEDYDALQTMAAGLGITSQTEFTGRVSPEAVAGYLAAADVSVDPVRDDDIARARSPLKVFESLAVGTPVVTSPVGDRAEILTAAGGGVLVDPNDPGALAQGLLDVLQYPGMCLEVRQKAAEYRERWSWLEIAPIFQRIYALGREIA